MSINLDRDVVVDVNLDNGQITRPNNASYYNTDSNIAFFYIKLHKTTDIGVVEYVKKEEANNYEVKMKVVKPKSLNTTTVTSVQSNDLIDGNCALYKFTIENHLLKEVGNPFCYVSIAYDNQELVTDGFTYHIKQDPLGKYNLVLLNDPDMPLLKSLLEEVKNNVGGIDDENVRDNKSFSSYKTTQIANNLSSQIKEINTKIDSWDSEENVGTSTSIRVNNQLFTNENGIITLPDYPTITFNDFTTEQTSTEKILKFKGVEIFRCSLQVPGSSGATTYSVTYNLSNCSSDVKTSSITSGSSYSTTITANSGYTMSSITVTMGGTNITSTVVSGNRISISNVTGNIVITATASSSVTTYTVTNNLTNCSSNNNSNTVNANYSYTSTLSPNDGYTIDTITVTMGGVDITGTVVNDNNINIPVVEGNVVITATASISTSTPTTYTVTNNLTNCSSDNRNATVNANSSYLATLSPNSNYTMSSITVTMGGVDVTNSVVSGTSINIPSVTGNIVITATASSNEDINNDITILGSNISIPNGRGTINSYKNGTLEINTTDGDRVTFIINNLNLKDNSVYKFSCSFNQENSTCFESIDSGEVYTGGIKFQKSDITNYNDISFTFNTYNWSTASNPSITCAIHGTSLLGMGIFNNIKITKIGELEKYAITNELTNVTNNNNLTEIVENQNYTATIVANSGYTVNTITVTMGGTDITSQVVSGNSINIPSVTGNVVITATASISTSTTTYTVTNNLTNCSTNNNSNTVNANHSYEAILSPNSNYEMSSVTVVMGGIDITSDVVEDK